MKKTIFTLALLSVVMVSCSDDTNNAINQERSANKEFTLFTTSNTTGKVSVTDLNESTPTTYSFSVASTDADGAYYFDDSDELILASRSNNRVEGYAAVYDAVAANAVTLALSY
ncbi:MAG: hypothetical protein ACK4R6_14760, partial [Spirosomataceae bacterium]